MRCLTVLIYELFEDLTIPQLSQSTERGFPDTTKRQHVTHEVRVNNIQYMPFTSNNILKVVTTTTSNNGNGHNQMVELRRVQFEPSDTPTNATFKAKDGQDYHILPLKTSVSTVGVACDCEDYIMRFASFNLNNNCHVGPIPPKYIRKTTTRPPANPLKQPGMCKHLIKVVEELSGFGLLR